ncbi:hypothetical protein BZG36_01518 [Bifiguratus adelaidae]|uniref:Amino acid permease/ SLC12A domain-containing protein n=1 Tax=Bifiguratus adelaidae TaxID=1938954 RepID=A0A261Y4X8_9FUNG|nr:hypothetical protein BZG36_01518 [Bifiguratus adelaidae]
MSRFLSRTGSSMEALQNHLSRRNTLESQEEPSPSTPFYVPQQEYSGQNGTQRRSHSPIFSLDGTRAHDDLTAFAQQQASSTNAASLAGRHSRTRRSVSEERHRQPAGSVNRTNERRSQRRHRSTAALRRHRPPLETIYSGAEIPQIHTFARQSVSSKQPLTSLTSAVSRESLETVPNMPHVLPRQKLSTFDGVFVPTVLTIWGIILFLRFGFIIGQAGVIGTLAMFGVGYAVNCLTVLSLSAISTNGTVRGGGPYYMISRSLGTEFGGSIGLVFYLGLVLGGSMNVLGFVEPLIENFSRDGGYLFPLLPDGKPFTYLYGFLILIICTSICLTGSKLYARTSLFLACLVFASTASIFVSFAFQEPFTDIEKNVIYTGWRWETFKENLWPQFQRAPVGGRDDGLSETARSIFGILFPACNGVLAGAQMSGDLSDPSRSIPKGTLNAVWITLLGYSLIVILMGGSVDRSSMLLNLNILEEISLVPALFAIGSLAAAIFAVLGAVIGSAKILQAVARDNLLPILNPLSKGTKDGDEPFYGVLFTFSLIVIFCFAPSINTIANFVTMTALLTFCILNLACCLLKLSSAPNFRPSFHFFKWWTALAGFFVCIVAMLFVNELYALLSLGVMLILFVWIHYQSPPKSWGDVTQSLIYHQVRKYLLRLDQRKEHVKFWRPQILLLVNNPRTSYQMIQFCNSLKKGALYILGHVIKSQDFQACIPEFRRQQLAWLRFVDVANIKAFVQIIIAPSESIGARSLLLGSGLGGMRPNIVVMGDYDLTSFRKLSERYNDNSSPYQDHRKSAPVMRTTSKTGEVKLDLLGSLPTDHCRSESTISPSDYVSIIEDTLSLNKAVAIAFGFEDLERYMTKAKSKWGGLVYQTPERKRKYIDLWPIQVSTDLADNGNSSKSLNFDTYTMVLQLGTILHMVSYWKEHYTLRVICFVEHVEDVEDEKRRVQGLLRNLRIDAQLRVLCLEIEGGEVYEAVVGVKAGANSRVDQVLGGNPWWNEEIAKRHFVSAWTEGEAEEGSRSTPPIAPNESELVEELEDTEEQLPWNALRPANRRRLSMPNAVTATAISLPSNNSTTSLPQLHELSSQGATASSPISTYGLRINMPIPDHSNEDSSSSDDNLSDNGNNIFNFEERPRRKRPRRPRFYSLSDAFARKLPQAKPQATKKRQTTLIDGIGQILHRSPFVHSPPSPRASRPGPASELLIQAQTLDESADEGETDEETEMMDTETVPKQLEFNDLPSEAQHLILNYLMCKTSDDTAIIFSTLPAPVKATAMSEDSSVTYLENLKLLVDGLPPVLLVHATSLTVTMSL